MPRTLSSRGQSHLEAVSPPLGPHGICCAGGSTSSSAHMAMVEVSLKSGPVPTERPTGYCAGHQVIVCGPQVVEGAREQLERQQARSILASAGDILDVPLKGCGALHEGRGTSGNWGVLGQGQQINVLELRAIHLALWHFLLRLQGHRVLVRTVSTMAAAYVNSATNQIDAVTCSAPEVLRRLQELLEAWKSPSTLRGVVSQAGLSHWVVEAIQQAYRETSGVPVGIRAHSTRGVSTSWFLWRSAILSTLAMFTQFYCLNVAASTSLGECVPLCWLDRPRYVPSLCQWSSIWPSEWPLPHTQPLRLAVLVLLVMAVSLIPSCVRCIFVYSSWLICTHCVFCLFVHLVAGRFI